MYIYIKEILKNKYIYMCIYIYMHDVATSKKYCYSPHIEEHECLIFIKRGESLARGRGSEEPILPRQLKQILYTQITTNEEQLHASNKNND